MHVAGVKLNKKPRREEEEMKGFEAIEKKKKPESPYLCDSDLLNLYVFHCA